MHHFNTEKINAVIVEDNHHSLLELKHQLKSFPFIKIIGEATSGEAAVRLIDRQKPDLVFLDIQLPEMDGFQVLGAISHSPQVIFVSAHDHYAVKAFDANGIDYLLKPIETPRLETALEKAVRQRTHLDHSILEELQRFAARHDKLKRFAVKLKDQILIIPREEICFFHAEDKYVFLNTWDKSYFYPSTLKTLTHQLDPQSFFRINKSVVVSLDKVLKLKRSYRGEFYAVMDNKERNTFKISKRCLSEFKTALSI